MGGGEREREREREISARRQGGGRYGEKEGGGAGRESTERVRSIEPYVAAGF